MWITFDFHPQAENDPHIAKIEKQLIHKTSILCTGCEQLQEINNIIYLKSHNFVDNLV
jgi:hypothetical protein